MDQAKQELNGTGLGIKQVGTASSDTVEKGQIISQDPQDGKTVEKNTTIEVIISSGSAGNVRMQWIYQMLSDKVRQMPARH